MVFSSIEFLFLFLPITAIAYFALPSALKNTVLLVFSLVFYAYGEPTYIFLMLFTVMFDWICGMIIGRPSSSTAFRKGVLVVCIIVNLLLLAYFKYAALLVECLSVFPILSGLTVPSVLLPIGISFYTFQSLSYVIDVYRREAERQRDPLAFGLYVSLFPQLVAGPIVRYSEVATYLKSRKHSFALAASGIRTFCAGLAKKVLIGNAFGELWEAVRDLPLDRRTALAAWFGLFCFTLQIYFDFSGYSDMAIGLGKLFGFRFPENFYYPYTAKSPSDFWRRWHITLSGWFREYVYIPLGGNRRGTARTLRNLFIVWTLTGLWHGASLNFLLWGLYWFIMLVLDKFFFSRITAKVPRLLSTLCTFLIIMFGWLIFVFDGSKDTLTFSAAIGYMGNLFGSHGAFNGTDIYDLLRTLPLIAIALFAATSLPKKLFWRFCEKRKGSLIAADVAALLCLLVSTSSILASAYNPFLYFRF